MRRVKQMFLAMTVFIFGFTFSASAYEALNGPTGVLKYVKNKSFNGYTFYAPMVQPKNPKAYLMDMEGYIVHKWDLNYPPGLYGMLLENGNLLVGGNHASLRKGIDVAIGGSSGIIQELDWNSNVVWEYKMATPTEIQHHCFVRMANGNTMILGWELKSIEEAIAKGRDPKTIPTSVFDRGKWHTGFWSDFVREVDKNGKTVWEWHVWDHIGVGPTKIDINYVMPKPVGANYASFDWTHGNTVDYMPESDEVIVNFRNMGEFVIINHKTGNIVWRWGNPCAYGQGECPSYYNDGDQQLFGQHHVSYLGKDVFQIFDNGSERPEGNRSRVVRVNRKSGKVVWEYESKDSSSFYSYRQGAAQALANGNVHVTSTQTGHLFEVNKKKQIVWEFVNPFLFGKAKCHFEDGDLGHNSASNMIHRSYRYADDYPGLKGKTLKRQGLAAKNCPQFWKVYGLDKIKGSKPMKIAY